jgi:probable phosphoglycerate mutase
LSTPATRIHCLRHAEIDARWHGQIYGKLDVPLSSRGARDSLAAARRFADTELTAVVSSGLARTEHLAQALRAPRGLARRDDPRLVEIDRGAWAGLELAELERREPGAFAGWLARPKLARPLGGESLADVQARALDALQDLAQAADGGEVAVVAHLWVLRSVLCWALGLDLDRAARLDLPYAGHFALDIPLAAGRRPVLVGLAMHATVQAAPSRDATWQRGPHWA